MKVAIVNNQAPFVRGGAELLAEWLAEKLREHGHATDVVRIPFRWHPPEQIVDHMLAARLIRLPNADRVVTLKFPAYYVPHENKVHWLLHQFRQAYDLWGTPFQDLPDDATGLRVRDAVIAADRRYLPEARATYTNSRIVGERLRLFSKLPSEVLFPPLPDPGTYRCDAYGDYLFYPSRITAGKRQHLAIRALSQADCALRLVIAGEPETPADLQRLRAEILAGGLENRVTVLPRWISESEKIDLLAGARAVMYLPFGEDSYGYVTLEAFHARKPVLTLADAGGVMELVTDGRNGLVADDVAGLARAIEQIAGDDRTAARLGDAAVATIGELDISWDRVVRCLTS